MQSIKNDFSAGLDLDSSPYRVAPNAYTDALNISKDAVAGGNDLVVTNIVGNQLVNYTLPAGTNKCIGAFPHTLRNTVIYFVWNSNGYHLILEYNRATGATVPVFANLTDSDDVDVLGFTEHEKINSVNVYPRETEGDLLSFIDSLKRPTGLNITRFKNGEYTPVTRDIIDIGKRPPLAPPTSVFGNDVNRRANNFRKKLFRFKYRYVYDDFEKSTCSPIGAIPLPANILTETYTGEITNNNVIRLSLNSGAKNVSRVELLGSFVEASNDWSDFLLLDSIDLAFGVTTLIYSTLTLSTTYSFGFRGLPPAGTVITVKLRRLSDNVILDAATYTTVLGDTPTTVATALAASAGVIGISVSTDSDGTLYILYDSTLYAYSDIVVTEPAGVFVEDVDFPYSFYNDSTYPTIDISESIQLYDYVPDEANAQELVNGNVLTYWGITEGYDRELEPNVAIEVDTVAAGSGSSTGSLNATVEILNLGISELSRTGFTGMPATGTIVTMKVKRVSDNVILDIATYTTLAGDTILSVINGMTASANALGIASSTSSTATQLRISWVNFIYDYSSFSVQPPASSATSNSIATFPFSTERRLALEYFDQKGKTNGVLWDTKVTFPAYAENGSQEVLLPYINAKIYHIPPSWAYSYQWVLTKENTNYIYWMTSGVNKAETNYLYFDVSNFPLNAKKSPTTAEVLSYTFQDGDRVRLIRNDTSNLVFDDDYDAAIEGLVVDPKINGVSVVGTFLKIKKVAPFNDGLFDSVVANNLFVIQIYRPAQQLANSNKQVFYEFGEQYYIGDPTLSTRYHMGQVTDQVLTTGVPAEFNFYNGDAYFRQRSVVISETGSATYNALDRNFVDFYISAVNNINGRPSLIDVDAKRAYYSTMVRFGQAYQPNTNINGLNRFFPNNFDEYDLGAGDIMRVKTRDRYVRVFQKYKVGSVPIFNQISKNADGTQLLVVTDKLLNPIQYYAGNKGIGEHSGSLVSNNFADYFTTNVVGEICRLSSDGINPISVMYKVNSWATEKLPLRIGNYKVYGAFDQKLNKYICALEATGSDTAVTITFNEKENSFDSFISLFPEMMCTLGTLLISFKNGQLYTHDSTTYNNFFGVQYNSEIETVFNQGTGSVKSFMALEEKANGVWAAPEIETSLMSYGTTPQQSNLVNADFEQKEGKWCAALLRDSNSIGGINGGDQLKGDWIKIKLRNTSANNLVSLNLLNMRFIDSALNNK